MAKKSTVLIFLLAVALAVAGYYYLINEESEEKTTTEPDEFLENKVREALDPNKHFDAEKCVVGGKNIPVAGYIFRKESEFLYIKTGRAEDELEKKVRLTPNTLFIRIELSASGQLVSEEEIGYDNLAENDSVTVIAFCNPDNPEDLIALVVKKIIYRD